MQTRLFLSFTILFFSIQLFAVNSPATKKMQADVLGFDLLEQLEINTINDFLALSPRQIRKKTGKRLKLKEIIGLKVVQKKLKKKVKANPEMGATPVVAGDKSQLVALLLAIFVGVLGIHRFYLGYTGIGIIQILTAGGCGIWALIDLILIAVGKLGPADGSSYDTTI